MRRVPAAVAPDERVGARLGVGVERDTFADALQYVFSDQVPGRQAERVLPIETCPTQSCLRLLGRRDQAGQRYIAEAVGTDGAANPLSVEAVRDQLRTGGEVDAVEARPGHRR